MLRPAVVAIFVSMLAVPARAAVDEAALEMLAEASALAKRCKDLKGDWGVVRAFAKRIGIDEADLRGDGQVNDFLTMREAEFEAAYASLSVDGACAKARYFYGPQGTKVPGLLKKP